MKILDGYSLKKIAGNFVIIPIGQNIVDYKSMLHVNESGAFIWKQLEEQKSYDEILLKLAEEYEASKDEIPRLKEDLTEFIQKIKTMNLISED